MVFGGRRCKCDTRTVMVNGAELHRMNATVHLGHHISTNDNDSLVSDIWFLEAEDANATLEQLW